MSPHTGLIALACYFLSIAISTEASIEDVPDCYKTSEKKWKVMPNQGIRIMLFAEVIDAKGQEHDPKYTCELEELAYDLVNEPGVTITHDKLIYTGGIGKVNLKTAVASWKDQLKNMTEKKEFGCNFSLGSASKIGCIFK